jgi:pimeloyl-ACP methyl ester carboxylesterase
VLAAVDSARGKPMVVGHSAACGLAWLAADRRPERLAKVALVGGFPTSDGKPYADFFEVRDGVMPFPGWGPFEGPDASDLDDAARREFAATAIPVPEGVAKGVVRLADERRFEVPVVVVFPELARAAQVDFADIDSGHWPMVTRPEELARVLAAAADAA